MTGIPFYNPEKSYSENYQEGPFGAFAHPTSHSEKSTLKTNFLGQSVHLPFGIPAGPLINGKFVKAALDMGFDLPVYKTVRTQVHPCHPWPNVLAVHPGKKLDASTDITLPADHTFAKPLSITNSFGVPSFGPEVWQPDLADAVKYAKSGQVVIGSFQGTKIEGGTVQSYIDDFVLASSQLKETGVKIIEVNLSCPNEGTANLLCFDIERVELIVQAIKQELGSIPLILKMAYFANDAQLEHFVTKLGGLVQGLSAINTIAATIVDANGKQALPGEGRLRSGVCGTSIKWAGLEMVERLATWRQKLKMDYAIIGVGGVAKPADYQEYRAAGADAVMSATGAMWNPYLAQEIKGLIS